MHPNGETNFWKFYVQNQDTINRIIDFHISSSVDDYYRDDIHQDVLMCLDRCKVLESFDESKCAFNTYFTNRVMGYVKNWFSKQKNSNPTWHPFPNASENYDIDEQENDSRWHRVYFKSINGSFADNQDDECYSDKKEQELTVENAVETKMDINQNLQILRSKLKSSLVNVFDLLVKGYTNNEIAAHLNTDNLSYIAKRKSQIAAIGMKIFAN